jgi:hypothetical protein
MGAWRGNSGKREFGYIKFASRSHKWQAIAYRRKGEAKIGDYDTRDEAVAALRAHVESETK